MVVDDPIAPRSNEQGGSRVAPRRTQRTENLDRYSIAKDRRTLPSRPVQGRGPSRGPASRSGPCRCVKEFIRGGADRDRTDDLGFAKPALSQLSYSPVVRGPETPARRSDRPEMVGLGRFELPTSRLSGGRSNQLSYRPALQLDEPNRRDRIGSASPVSENGITRGDGEANDPSAPRLNESPGEPGIQALLPDGAGRGRSRPVARRLLMQASCACCEASDGSKDSRELPRKEVIQPQVPLRLPCYDFTPITGQTLGGSPPCGLGYRLLVPPAFVV